jgi:hypothetical protein
MSDETLTPAELAIMRHTLGLSEFHPEREPYRNFFDAGDPPSDGHPGHSDLPTLLTLESRGLMARSRPPGFMPRETMVFHVTEAGKACKLAFPIPKLTRGQRRYRNFLRADCGLSFGEWLKCYPKEEIDAR